MCGILFAIRSSASYQATGGSPPESGLGDSPQSASSPVVSGPEFGIPLADGTRPASLNANEAWDTMVDAVRSRGPDSHNSLIRRACVQKTFHFELRFHASVLHMRGTDVTPQPFVADNGDVFLWNGEIFDGLNVAPNENDGRKLFDLILREGPSNFFAAIRNIEGPYAFVYYQASNQRIYFARSNGPSSDYPLYQWEEVACDSVHCYHLLDLKGKSWLVDGKRGLSSYPRYPKSMGLSQDILIYPFDRIRAAIPPPHSLLPSTPLNQPVLTSELHLTIQNFLKELELAVRKRVTNLPPFPPAPLARVAVLFSGGIDCTTVALLVDRVLPVGEGVDLINVAFENPRSLRGDVTVKGKKKGGKKGKKGKGREEEVEVDGMEVDGESVPPSPMGQEEEEMGGDEAELGEGLGESGVLPTPLYPSIYNVPDRLTGRDSWRELQKLRPGRRWNFVEVDVPYAEMLEHRQKVIDLMKPNRTVMDLSIAIAFYFAARGLGTVESPIGGPPLVYQSFARVLLSGLGADELLGGYARHRRAFDSGPGTNWAALIAELQMDVDRLSSRNLGRDDRIISYWGKEARYPFLAGHVVDFCARTVINQKCDLRFGEGVGDKLLLRMLAKSLGLSGAAQLKKRAIHFGARTAKMELGSGGLRGEDLLE